jgi:hypothetical protein
MAFTRSRVRSPSAPPSLRASLRSSPRSRRASLHPAVTRVTTRAAPSRLRFSPRRFGARKQNKNGETRQGRSAPGFAALQSWLPRVVELEARRDAPRILQRGTGDFAAEGPSSSEKLGSSNAAERLAEAEDARPRVVTGEPCPSDSPFQPHQLESAFAADTSMTTSLNTARFSVSPSKRLQTVVAR